MRNFCMFNWSYKMFCTHFLLLFIYLASSKCLIGERHKLYNKFLAMFCCLVLYQVNLVYAIQTSFSLHGKWVFHGYTFPARVLKTQFCDFINLKRNLRLIWCLILHQPWFRQHDWAPVPSITAHRIKATVNLALSLDKGFQKLQGLSTCVYVPTTLCILPTVHPNSLFNTPLL